MKKLTGGLLLIFCFSAYANQESVDNYFSVLSSNLDALQQPQADSFSRTQQFNQYEKDFKIIEKQADKLIRIARKVCENPTDNMRRIYGLKYAIVERCNELDDGKNSNFNKHLKAVKINAHLIHFKAKRVSLCCDLKPGEICDAP